MSAELDKSGFGSGFSGFPPGGGGGDDDERDLRAVLAKRDRLQARYYALHYAVKFDRMRGSPNDVVECAEEFFAFLTKSLDSA